MELMTLTAARLDQVSQPEPPFTTKAATWNGIIGVDVIDYASAFSCRAREKLVSGL